MNQLLMRSFQTNQIAKSDKLLRHTFKNSEKKYNRQKKEYQFIYMEEHILVTT